MLNWIVWTGTVFVCLTELFESTVFDIETVLTLNRFVWIRTVWLNRIAWNRNVFDKLCTWIVWNRTVYLYTNGFGIK